MLSLFNFFIRKRKKQEIFYPCRKCVYYIACGDGMRTKPCEDRKTKEELVAKGGPNGP